MPDVRWKATHSSAVLPTIFLSSFHAFTAEPFPFLPFPFLSLPPFPFPPFSDTSRVREIPSPPSAPRNTAKMRNPSRWDAVKVATVGIFQRTKPFSFGAP